MNADPEELQAYVARIAQREVQRFARLLADEIASTMNARDFWPSLNDTIKRYERGEDA